MHPKRLVAIVRSTMIVLVTVQFTLAAASSHVYVYADPHAAASSWQPVTCDGSIVAKIKKGTFFAMTVSSGRHAFRIAEGTPTFVDVEPNHDLFLRLDEHIIIGEPRVLLLSPVTPDLARKEMRFLPYIPAKKVLSPDVSAEDPRIPEEPKFKTRQENQ